MPFTFETSLTAESLSQALRGRPTDAKFAPVLDEAVDLLTDATVSAWRTIPESVCDDLVIRVAKAIWDARKSQGDAGPQSTQVEAQATVRRPRDPMKEAEPLLSRYVVMGLG